MVDLERVWVLTDEQTAHFWTYRPCGVRVSRLNPQEWRDGKIPDYSVVKDRGVMYVIDEVHNFFGARQWAETGRDVLFYLSQHRKLGDTVVCITQAINNVDKQFRSVTQDFTFVRNLSKERYGIFKMPAYFVRKTFTSPPTETSKPMESGTFTLDVRGLAACYDSAAGVGIHGRGADMLERGKGLHWSWFVLILAVVVGVLFFGVPRAIASMFKSSSPAGIVRSSVAANSVPSVSPVSVAPVVVRGPVAPVVAAGVSNVAPAVYISGVARAGDKWWVTLSDGRVLRSGDVRWQAFSGDQLLYDGRVYKAQ